MLTMQIEDRNGIRLVQLAGPLNAETCEDFWNRMDPLVNTSGIRLVLDCERLFFASSRGLSMLARCQQSAARNGSFFGIAALARPILKGIELLGMAKILKIYPTVFAAMEAAAAS